MRYEYNTEPLENNPYDRGAMLNRAADLYRSRIGAQDKFDEAAENYNPAAKPITSYSALKDQTGAFSRKQWQEIRGQIAERDPNMGFNELQRKTGEYFSALLNKPTNRPSGFAEIKSPTISIGVPQLSEMGTYTGKTVSPVPASAPKTVKTTNPTYRGRIVPGTAPLDNANRPQYVPADQGTRSANYFLDGWKSTETET